MLKKSAAASAQSYMGKVASGSVFSTLQSAAAGGIPALAVGVAAVGVGLIVTALTYATCEDEKKEK